MKIFVYGSLKKGFHNHHILDKADFLGKGETVERYPMFEVEKEEYPYLLDIFHYGAENIVGEVYEVDEKLLKRIDYFEGVPEYYFRKTIQIKLEGLVVDAEVYFFKEIRIPEKTPLKVWEKNNEYYVKEILKGVTRC